MRTGTASGLQIVVLVFAVTLLAVPLTVMLQVIFSRVERTKPVAVPLDS